MAFKADGRVKPAKQSEMANLKGKHMVCPVCGEISILAKASFADEKCQGCNVPLQDMNTGQAKLDGSR